MLNKHKQQQIVYLFLINCGTPEHNMNCLKRPGGSCYGKQLFFETLSLAT